MTVLSIITAILSILSSILFFYTLHRDSVVNKEWCVFKKPLNNKSVRLEIAGPEKKNSLRIIFKHKPLDYLIVLKDKDNNVIETFRTSEIDDEVFHKDFNIRDEVLYFIEIFDSNGKEVDLSNLRFDYNIRSFGFWFKKHLM